MDFDSNTQNRTKLAQLTHYSSFSTPVEQSIGQDVYAFNFAPGGRISFTTSAPRVDIGLTYEGNFNEGGERVPCSGDPFSRVEGGCGVLIIEVNNEREYTFNGDDILGTLTSSLLGFFHSIFFIVVVVFFFFFGSGSIAQWHCHRA